MSSDNSQSLDSKASKPAKNALENALENQIIELIKQSPLITQVEIAREIGHSRSKVQNVIKKLLENGRIEITGAGVMGNGSLKHNMESLQRGMKRIHALSAFCLSCMNF